MPDQERTRTGIAGLDQIMNGGFPRGHLFVVEGEPGTGKTTLGMQFLIEGARLGEKAMYITLSESKRELEGVARSHHWALHGVDLFEFTPTEESLRAEDQYSAFHPGELEFQDTTDSILAEVERIQPARIVFDSLNEIRLLARDSLRYRRQILALKHYFSNRGCTVLLLDDKTAEGHDMQLHSIAHGVVSMERLQREYGVERRRIRVAKLRGSRFREGYHDYRIETGGIVIHPRLIANEHLPLTVQTVAKSGLPQLDALWGGGLPRGSSTLILGPPGSGKSSIAIRYALEATQRGEFASAYLFDETRQTLLNRCIGLGMDLQGAIDKGLLTIDQVDPAELSPGEFVGRIRFDIEQKQTRVLIIDSLNGFMNAMPGEDYLMLQMHELLSYLNQSGVVTILVMAQEGLLGPAMRSPIELSYLSDNILLMRYFETQGRVRKAISVVKKRSGMHEGTIREFSMDQGQIRVGAPLSQFHGVLTGVPTFIGQHESLNDDTP